MVEYANYYLLKYSGNFFWIAIKNKVTKNCYKNIDSI